MKNAKYPIVLVLAREARVGKDLADAVLNLPFTVQKLANRIRPLLPGDGDNILHIGPVRLDVERRRVRSLNKNSKLPRLVTLLRILMERHGEVVEREELFKKVWDTDYTGDTRTLDVHISWLRRAIELDPLSPASSRPSAESVTAWTSKPTRWNCSPPHVTTGRRHCVRFRFVISIRNARALLPAERPGRRCERCPIPAGSTSQ